MRRSSSQPRKQRLMLYRAPLHKKHTLFNARLSEELVGKFGIKRLPIRVGDVVKIMRGDWAGHEGKVVRVDYEKVRVFIEGVTIKKADGTPVYYPIHPSKVMIIKADVSDKVRKKIIERRKGRVPVEEAEEVKKEEEERREQVGEESG
ncbi:MAG: 50S ribosomal protein L24 [Desulfurococcales archaeon]|nr:50S ribosomal protein L24 [Desulfurococcales archaeon]